MDNEIRTGDPRGFNKGRSSKFHVYSRVRQTPEEGRKTYRPKHRGNSNKDEGNRLKTLNDKNHLGKSWPFLFSSSYVLLAQSLFFYKNDFGIKSRAKVDMPLNKETKHISTFFYYFITVLIIKTITT